jgi:hypothetical protein
LARGVANECLAALRVGDVQRNCQRLVTVGPNGCRGVHRPRFVDVTDDDTRAMSGQPLRKRAPEPARGTSDGDDAAGQVEERVRHASSKLREHYQAHRTP